MSSSPDSATVAPAEFSELGPGNRPGSPADFDLLADVSMTVTVELGRRRMQVRELLALREGTLVELTREAGAPVDVLVNGSLIARGEVVVIDEELGVRITEVTKRS